MDPPVGQHGYISGTTVWLTATADTGSTFAGWNGSATGMANPISVTMDSDEIVTATFVTTGCVNLTGITIAGDTSGASGNYTFTTSYQPTYASTPISYLWDDGGASATSIRSLGVGAHTLMVTATNCTFAMVTGTHEIVISGGEHDIYLPLVMRSYP